MRLISPRSGGELRLANAFDGLIELYTAINKPDEVTKWQAERAKYPSARQFNVRRADGVRRASRPDHESRLTTAVRGDVPVAPARAASGSGVVVACACGRREADGA